MFAIQTVRDGQRVAVWDARGRVRLVDGPRRLFLFRKTVEKLPLISAEADEYLAVHFVDGHCEHLRGPVSIWRDPILHREINIEKALPIDSHEAVVVYRRENGKVSRSVVRGPAQFVPDEHQWLHEFRWHGSDPRDASRKIPRALRFKKLRVIPDQMYHQVEDVRTADDALLKVKLMVFFELADIERMLDQTHDPTADFINAVTADVIEFVGAVNFEQFKQQTERLNELATYANLTSRAERIGYRINKVVYRGYLASQALQQMHDGAIEARTQLKLEAETERQAQDLADLKLERTALREEKQREIDRRQNEHAIQLKQLDHQEQLRQDEAEHRAEVAHRRQLNELELEHQQASNQEQAEFLTAMQGMKVDLTRYLVAQYQHPDRLIRIAGDDGAQVHLHDV